MGSVFGGRGLGLCGNGMRASRFLLSLFQAHFRSRGNHRRCIHYNAVSPHEDWMHPFPSLPHPWLAAPVVRPNDVGNRSSLHPSLPRPSTHAHGQCRSCGCGAQSRPHEMRGRRGQRRRKGDRGGRGFPPILGNKCQEGERDEMSQSGMGLG